MAGGAPPCGGPFLLTTDGESDESSVDDTGKEEGTAPRAGGGGAPPLAGGAGGPAVLAGTLGASGLAGNSGFDLAGGGGATAADLAGGGGGPAACLAGGGGGPRAGWLTSTGRSASYGITAGIASEIIFCNQRR
jgi:hypothetical protein